MLSIGAVIGHEIPLPVWEQVSQATPRKLLQGTTSAVARHMLEELPDGTGWRFVHSLIRETLYRQIPLLLRRSWHREIAEVIARQSVPNPDLVAEHFRLGGDDRAIDWLLRAADRAEESYAWIVAAERLKTTLPMLGNRTEWDAKRGWVLFRLAHLLRYADSATSLEYVLSAKEFASNTADRTLEAHATFESGALHVFGGDLISGVAEMETGVAALKRLSKDEIEWGRQHGVETAVDGIVLNEGMLMLHLAHSGRIDEVLTLGSRYVADIVGIDADLRTQPNTRWIDAWMGLGEAHALMGNIPEARSALRTARRFFREVGDHFMVAATCIWELWHVVLPYETDDLAMRSELSLRAEVSLAPATSALGWDVLAVTRIPSLLPALIDGDWSDAERVAEFAIEFTGTTGYWAALTVIGSIAHWRGDSKRFGRTSRLHENLLQGNWYFSHRIQYLSLLALHLIETGDLDSAAGWLHEVERALDGSGSVWGQADAALLRARYLHASHDDDQALRHAKRALSLASDPRQPLVLINVHRFLGQLATETGTLVEAEYYLDESLGLADACAAPFERARTLLALADLRIAQRQSRTAVEMLREVREICEPLGANPTLAKVEDLESRIGHATRNARARPGGLTGREREVLHHAAQGLTDPEIAERLGIGTRTVNSHMASIFNKVGVSSRTAAAVWAKENGVV